MLHTTPVFWRIIHIRTRKCDREPEEKHMSKEEAIAAIKLLSALESWILSQSVPVPDYIHEDLCQTMKVFERVVLCGSTRTQRTALPDAITDDSESPQYRDGWNECREVMKGMMK
jgi:hypothetical protein